MFHEQYATQVLGRKGITMFLIGNNLAGSNQIKGFIDFAKHYNGTYKFAAIDLSSKEEFISMFT